MVTTTPKCTYTQEVRFAVVMYGGVSLAIYMNGITQELYHLVRATAPKDGSFSEAFLSNEALSRTERVYRKLGQMISRDGQIKNDINDNDASDIQTRFVIDILSGTSAGGINAIFLAKALANNQKIDQLRNLWITEGDIDLLLNDKKSVKNLGIPQQDPPQSLLNSRRMYLKLFKAFDDMEDSAVSDAEEAVPAVSPYVDELDLFVTATDIQGIPLPLRLSDAVVYERRHKTVYRFSYRTERVSDFPQNDLTMNYNPFLAFAARCTSSFPFAFEPMSLTDIDEVIRLFPRYRSGSCPSDSNRWNIFFRDYLQAEGIETVPFRKRSFGDGGYLNNKPFSYATEALMKRQADVPVDRKLIYIEPSPEHPEEEHETDRKPDAIENVMAAVLKVPRYETIREDLQQVLERNRRVERVSRITNGIEDDVTYGLAGTTTRQGIKTGLEWAAQDLKALIQQNGIGYGGYHRLKVGVVSDDIADLIASISGFDTDSDQYFAIRYLVRAWRSLHYVIYYPEPGNPESNREDKYTENRFLFNFDLGYRMRRLNYVRSRLDSLYCLKRGSMNAIAYGETKISLGPEETERFKSELLRVKSELNKAFRVLRMVRRRLWSKGERNPLLNLLGEKIISPADLHTILDGQNEEARMARAKRLIEERKDAFAGFLKILSAEISKATRECSRICTQTLTPPVSVSTPEEHAKASLWHYYQYYEDYDMIIFPILHCQDMGEADTVEVIRISPEDATSIIDEKKESKGTGRKKLAGISLGHFGAFLDKAWRVNDILWGRFDGAERIICALLPGLENKNLRDTLIAEAHEGIIAEDLMQSDREELCKLLVEAIIQSGEGEINEERLQKLAEAEVGSPINSGLQAILRSCLNEKDLLRFFREHYEVNRQPNPKTVLGTISRSIQVVGSMLENIAGKHDRRSSVAWIARLGQLFWGFVTVAVPGSIPQLIFKHWLKVLYTFEALLIGIALLLGNMDMRKLGLTALGITLAVNIAVWALRDYMRGRKKVLRVIILNIVTAIIALALIGLNSLLK